MHRRGKGLSTDRVALAQAFEYPVPYDRAPSRDARSELANDLTVAYLSSVVHNYDPPSHAVVRRHLSETCNGETETMK